jgi:hypothetical protein
VVGWGVSGVFQGGDRHGVFCHLGAFAQGSSVGSAVAGGRGVGGVVERDVGWLWGDAGEGDVARRLGNGGVMREVGVVAGHGGGGVACGKEGGRVG